MDSALFVETREDFENLIERYRTLFFDDRTLPEQVFSIHPREFLFGDFDSLMDARGWVLLHSLASRAGDQSVFVMTIDPSAVSHEKQFGYFNAFQVDALDKRTDSYLAAIDRHPPAYPVDCIRLTTNRLAIWGDSSAWGIWAERELQIAVLGISSDSLRREVIAEINTDLTPDISAALSAVSFGYRGGIVPPDFVARFSKNYGKVLHGSSG